EADVTRLTAEMKASKDEDLAASRETWEAATLALIEAGTLAWQVQRPLSAEAVVGTPLTIEAEDNSIIPGGKNPVNDTYVVTIPAPLERITAVRIEAVLDARFPGDEVARSGSTFFISEIEVGGTPAGASSLEPIRIAACRTNGATEPGFP